MRWLLLLLFLPLAALGAEGLGYEASLRVEPQARVFWGPFGNSAATPLQLTGQITGLRRLNATTVSLGYWPQFQAGTPGGTPVLLHQGRFLLDHRFTPSARDCAQKTVVEVL